MATYTNIITATYAPADYSGASGWYILMLNRATLKCDHRSFYRNHEGGSYHYRPWADVTGYQSDNIQTNHLVLYAQTSNADDVAVLKALSENDYQTLTLSADGLTLTYSDPVDNRAANLARDLELLPLDEEAHYTIKENNEATQDLAEQVKAALTEIQTGFNALRLHVSDSTNALPDALDWSARIAVLTASITKLEKVEDWKVCQQFEMDLLEALHQAVGTGNKDGDWCLKVRKSIMPKFYTKAPATLTATFIKLTDAETDAEQTARRADVISTITALTTIGRDDTAADAEAAVLTALAGKFYVAPAPSEGV